jgi:Tol biopolymer transport system component
MKNKTLTRIFLLTVFSIFLAFCINREEASVDSSSEGDFIVKIPFSGKIIFQSNFDGDNEIYLLSESSLEQLTNNTWQDEYPVWSPDGKKIAFSSNREGQYDIFTMNSDGKEVVSITSSPMDEKEPAWYSDGKKLAFTREEKKFLKKRSALYQVDINTHKTKKIIPQYSKAHGIANLSPSASLITFTGKQTIGWDTAIYNMDKNQVNFLNRGGN